MVKYRILNLDEIKKEYSFYLKGNESDRYFCNCGEQFLSDNEEEILELEKVLSGDDDEDEIFGDVYKDIRLALDKNISCPHCEKNYNDPDVRRKLISIGNYFISGFEYEDTDENLILYYAKACPEIYVTANDSNITFQESIKYIRFEKETKKLYYQDFGDVDEVEFDLDGVIKYVEIFFTNETDKIVNFFKLHMYINILANYVSDTKGSNIVSDFLDFVRSAPSQVGIPYIKKLLSIFYGIIKYSNLSTIALTKDSQFLYDLMLECDIPSSTEMKDSGATSPVKIFNFLVNKYINKLNEEVRAEDKDSQDFAYKSKQRIEYEKEKNKEEDELNYDVVEDDSEANYIIRENKDYKGGKVVRVDGKYQVLDAVEDGTISKFIYNHIENFSQYKQIIKYFKFYDKKSVITMLQKHDLDLLTHAIDVIYFRDKMEKGELDRVLQIIDSFLEGRFMFKDYKNVKEFSFVEYDDTRMMMEMLNHDPRRHFNKIKTYDALVEYHDNLVKYYKTKNEIERSGDIIEFVSKFNFLETKGDSDYEGPLEVVLFDTAERVMQETPEMRHSASEYAINVARGEYLMGSVFDRDPERPEDEMERFTIGFKYDKKNGLVFDQVKGFANKLGSNRFKRLVMEYLTDKDVSFQQIKDLKIKEELGEDEKL